MQATLPRAERVGKGGRARTAPQPNARITSSPKRPSTFQFRDHGHPRSRRGGSPGRVLQRKPVGRPKVIKGTVPSVPSRLGNRTLPACPHVRAARRDHQPAGRPGAAGGSAGRMVGVVCAGMVAHRPRGEAVQGPPIGPAFQTSAPRAKIKIFAPRSGLSRINGLRRAIIRCKIGPQSAQSGRGAQAGNFAGPERRIDRAAPSTSQSQDAALILAAARGRRPRSLAVGPRSDLQS
jgi:hypothetical protein